MAEPRSRTRGQSSAAAPPRTRAQASAAAPPRTRAPRAPRTRPPAAQPAAPEPQTASNERSLGDLFSDLTENLRSLVQRELELVKIEMKDQVDRGVKGVGMFAGAGVTAFVALLLVAMAAAWGLAEVVAPGLAFLIVGVVFGAIAAVLGLQGKKKFEQLNPVPRQTIETVKQDVQTAKESLSEGTSTDQPSNQSGDPTSQWSSAEADQYAATRRS